VVRVVLDTNVIVSGLIRPEGPPGRILSRLLDEAFVLVLSPSMVDELRRSIRRPRARKYIRLSEEELEGRLAQLETLADPVEEKLASKVAIRDPDDLMILAAAVEGRADYVVTGDDDLLTLDEHQGIAIVTPRAFLELLER
jgi:uncharacterized protein